VFIERNPTMNDVLAVHASHKSLDAKQGLVKAREYSIITVVDVVDRVHARFKKEWIVGKRGIGTEEIQGEDGTRSVSLMGTQRTRWR
jgi:DNA-binding protein Alba